MSSGATCKKCGGTIVEPDDSDLVKLALQKLALTSGSMPVQAERARRLLQRVFGWVG